MSVMPDVIPNIVNPIMPDTDNNRMVVIRLQYILSMFRTLTSFAATLQMFLVAAKRLSVVKHNELPTNIFTESVSSFV
jgi:hypothetical protein